MASERTIPILPCRRLDDVLPFYRALGFEQTYRQERPNPYLGLRRGAIELHFFGLEAFDPEQSLGSVILLVPDTAALYDAFAAGLRAAYGKLPVAGLPRITRPRRKQGTAGGFSVVDPGGNWLRVSATGDEDDDAPDGRLDRVLRTAARQGDAHGDEARAIAVLDAGLIRHADASDVDRAPVLVYLAELLVRTGDRERAGAILAEVRALDLDDDDRGAVAADLAAAAEIEHDLTDVDERAR
jgi:hypothetical protein